MGRDGWEGERDKEEGGTGGGRAGKGEGELDLDICPVASEFLVTPLLSPSPSSLLGRVVGELYLYAASCYRCFN